MSACVDLFSLPRKTGGYTICVQVVRDWDVCFSRALPERRMIFADEQGNRMSATVRGHDRIVFRNTLKEGRWYFISEFEVNSKSEESRFSNHPYHLFMNRDTVVDEAEDINVSKIFKFVDYDNLDVVKLRHNVVDYLGVVFRVDLKELCPAIKREYETIPSYTFIKFILKDFRGNYLYCFAKDRLASKFKKLWLRTRPEMPVICTLRFWDIKIFQGRPALYGEHDYSDVLLDHDCAEVHAAEDELHFSDRFGLYIDAYKDHPKRPKNFSLF